MVSFGLCCLKSVCCCLTCFFLLLLLLLLLFTVDYGRSCGQVGHFVVNQMETFRPQLKMENDLFKTYNVENYKSSFFRPPSIVTTHTHYIFENPQLIWIWNFELHFRWYHFHLQFVKIIIFRNFVHDKFENFIFLHFKIFFPNNGAVKTERIASEFMIDAASHRK